MRIAWAWDWLVAVPVFLWLAWKCWHAEVDLLAVVLGTLLLGGVCVGVAETLGF